MPSRRWAGLTLAAALALAVGIIVVPRPAGRASRDIEANEAAAIADLVRFATMQDQIRQVLFGRVSPEVLADPQAHVPGLAAAGIRLPVEPRFLRRERDGYRFHFDGTPATTPAIVAGAYEEVTYVAAPIEQGRSGRRTFAYHSREGRRIFARADRHQPTASDPVVHAW